MRLALIWALAALVAAALLVDAAADESRESKILQLLGGIDKKIRNSTLFDFDYYTQLFRKVYSSPMEKLMRRTYFIARAYRVAVSAIKYLLRKSSYYFALNHLSDATTREIESMFKRVGPTTNEAAFGDNTHPKKLEIPKGDGVGEGQKLQSGQSAPNELEEPDSFELSSVSVNNLIRGGANEVKSNNNEMPSLDLKTGLKEVRWVRFLDNPNKTDTSSSSPNESSSSPDLQLPDEVFLDLRTKSHCFSSPRDQGKCLSCYAFAMIAVMEWLYCMQTGVLLPFSEQHIISCGKEYSQHLEGCTGGWVVDTFQFIATFGLQLRSQYPYLEANGTCNHTIDGSTTGYIRPTYYLPLAGWSESKLIDPFLKYGPVYVDMMPVRGFTEYKGGVHGMGCKNDYSHAVVLIGHGREDGREYWLIRNSMGLDWGEAGHYKLDKQANCIHDDTLYLFTYFAISQKLKVFAEPDDTDKANLVSKDTRREIDNRDAG